MLKLYGGARSRASTVQWYLEELGVPYEFVLLDMKAGEHHQSEFLAINPMGKVPAIVEVDFELWESGAILFYLARKYGKISESPQEQAKMLQWIFFGNATLEPVIMVEASREQKMPQLMKPLNQILEQHSFLLGDEFSLADVAVGSILAFFSMILDLDLSEYPAVVDYVKRISERPAFQKTIGGRT